ncbi:MAG: tRNA pseudouridine(38-40) synthase TruA [Planctomycetes bacterium]|nr:tRNA pseudouridine(38-40) synthase TruA [Planctomycetota bacterium]
MRNWKLVLEYDGTDFAGWQVQPAKRTVQGVLQEGIRQVIGEEVELHAAGRTDAGVHAEGQVASFRTSSRLGPENILRGVNSLTPPAVSILSIEEAGSDFDASRSAKGKVYRYDVRMGLSAPALDRDRCHWIRWKIDLAAMREAARRFVGRHDFRAFQGADSPRKTTVREMFLCDMDVCGPRVSIRVGASGFLYKMARNIAGTLLEVGRGRRPAGSIPDLLAGLDRRRAGATAPAKGLYLERVIY